jgi:hypothetical protein
MKRISQFIITIFLVAGSAVAQTAQSTQSSRVEDLYRRLWCGGLLHVETPAEKEVAARRDSRRREYEFLLKIESFAKSWSTLAREYNGKGTFNVKTAKEVSKAFHNLEKTEGWPKNDRR